MGFEWAWVSSWVILFGTVYHKLSQKSSAVRDGFEYKIIDTKILKKVSKSEEFDVKIFSF